MPGKASGVAPVFAAFARLAEVWQRVGGHQLVGAVQSSESSPQRDFTQIQYGTQHRQHSPG